MKINGTDRINSDAGDYLVIVDNGTEGLSVWKQCQTAREALDVAARGVYGAWMLVKLVDITAKSQQDNSPKDQ